MSRARFASSIPLPNCPRRFCGVAKIRKTLAAGLPKLGRGRPGKAWRIAGAVTPAETNRRTLRASPPVGPTSPDARRTQDAASHHARHGTTPEPAFHHGGGVAPVRSPLPHRKPPWTCGPAARSVRRFKQVGRVLHKLFSPNLEKALVFLDDSLLPSTSNAVERGNRRHRKMQKSVSRVRSMEHIDHRIALDKHHESQSRRRAQATATPHRARTG